MNDAALWNEIGNIYLKLDLYDEAISVYLKSIEINPDSGWTYSNLAFSYFKKGEFGRAVSLYRIGIPLLDNPRYQSVTWNRLGDAFRALKDVENAILAYKKADDLEIGPSLSSVLANKPRTAPEKGSQPFSPVPAQKPAPAPVRVETSDGRTPPRNDPPAVQPNPAGAPPVKETPYSPASRLSDILRRSDQGQNLPENSHSRVQPLDPRQIAASNDKAVPVDNRGSLRTSYEIKKSNLLVIPSPDTVQLEEEQEYPVEDGGLQVPSISSLVGEVPPVQPNAYQPDPTPVQAKIDPAPAAEVKQPRPDSNINLEETLAKVHIYENITQSNPNNDRAWDTLGKLYKSLSRYEDAIGAYQQAIEKAPGREVYYYYLGLLYTVIKKDEDAAAAFENVLRLNPDYILAHSALAGIYRRMGLESKANDHISIALPRMDNESAYNLACFYAICGESDKAIGYLQLALRNKDTTIEWIKSDPDLELLHDDPRYQNLIQELDGGNPNPSSGNYFSSNLKGANNKLLPLLNNSLAR